MANKKVLTSAEAAKLLGVSLRTVQLWVEQGILPAWKTPGGHRRLPLESVQQLLDQQAAQVSGQSVKEETGPAKLLIVEDKPHLRKLYSQYFLHLNMPVKVYTAENGYQGLIMIGEIKPDLLITDLMMPSMDGAQMIETILDRQCLTEDRIVVVTEMDSGSEEVGELRDSRIQVLHKPLLLNDLKKVLLQKLPLLRGDANPPLEA
ncbi:response regulator [Marinobacterium aestuariivivens]|uniref:Response regulator n=1 Tax=Marinobacterium aestuariivivens TaxID=1698799 RepID=A0ABW1ZU51_9GAMM